MALTRLQQLCIAGESVEGTAVTAATLFSATNAKYLAIDPQMTFEVETYQRDVARESFTPLSPVAGAILGNCSFSLELNSKTGTPALGSPPQWELPLVAAGFRKERLIRLTVSSITNGPILHGQVLTSGGTATVIGNYYSGATSIWVSKGADNTLGNATTMSAGAATIAGSIATAAISSVTTNAGFGYFPWSVPLYKMTVSALSGAVNANDVIVGNVSGAIGIVYYGAALSGAVLYVRRLQGTFTASDTASSIYRDGSVLGFTANVSAFAQATDAANAYNIVPAVSIGLAKDGVRESLQSCRGSVSLSGNIGEPVLMNFNFSGVKTAAIDGGNIASVTYDDTVPPVLLGATMTAGDAAITTLGGQKSFCATSFSIDFANDVQYRRCMTASTGIDGIYINGRAPTMTIDPEQSPELDFDWMNNYFTSGNIRMDFTVGSVAGNKFRMQVLNSALTGVGQGDRNGLIVRDMTFGLHSGNAASVSGDNEFVIIWDLAGT